MKISLWERIYQNLHDSNPEELEWHLTRIETPIATYQVQGEHHKGQRWTQDTGPIKNGSNWPLRSKKTYYNYILHTLNTSTRTNSNRNIYKEPKTIWDESHSLPNYTTQIQTHSIQYKSRYCTPTFQSYWWCNIRMTNNWGVRSPTFADLARCNLHMVTAATVITDQRTLVPIVVIVNQTAYIPDMNQCESLLHTDQARHYNVLFNDPAYWLFW